MEKEPNRKLTIIVTGARHWGSYIAVVNALETVCIDYDTEPTDMILIHGGARGLDSMAGEIGTLLGMDVRPYHAHWCHSWDFPPDKPRLYECPKDCREMVGRPAGVIRNQKMLTDNPDIKLALSFHPDLANSKGTGDMCRRVDKADLERRHFDE